MSKWKEIVKSVAPTIGTVLGGPAAGGVIKVLSGVLLGKDDGTEQEIERAVLNATPSEFAAIKKADQEYKLKLKELDIDEKQLAYGDTADARDLAKETGTKPQLIISICVLSLYALVLIGLGFMFYYTSIGVIKPDQAILALVSMLLGVLTTEVPRVTGFWLGSSAGSKAKTAVQAMLAGKTGTGTGNGS